MNYKLKTIIGNGLPYGILFFCLSFILAYYTSNLGMQKTLAISAIMGICAMLINGMLYSRFTKPLKELEQITIELNDAETLLIQAPANFLIGDGLIPGKLFLTEERMIFKSYPDNEETASEYSWNNADLKPYKFHCSIQNAGGQFRLTASDNTTIMFEVDQIKIWKEAFL